jgi:hypothetical protein
MRPLSNLNLALNAARGAALNGVFDPEDGGTLTVWFDPSDAANRTLFTAPNPDQVHYDNKAAIDTSNDAVCDGSAGGASAHAFDTLINGVEAGRSDDSPTQINVVADLVQTFSRVGTGGFRLFFVMETVASETLDSIPFQNGANDPSGGGYAMHANRAADGSGTLRFQMYDGSTSGHAVTNLIVSNANNDLNDGNAHTVMIGRSIGSGTAGVDEMYAKIDGAHVVGSPIDLPSGLGAVDNDGSTNAAAGWMILGAAAAAPNLVQRLARAHWGELLLYKTDMDGGQEAAVQAYLKAKWGTV